MELPENFVLIDKSKGMTSFDVIRELRRKTGIKKWGHAGTLDPLATGLMILAYEAGTKQLTDFIKLDKEYEAEILIGERRSTGDMEGTVVESVSTVNCTKEGIESVVKSLVGTLTLPVSAYSAIKKAGVPMYKRARKAERSGERISVEELPVREMEVYEAGLLNEENTTIYRSNRSGETINVNLNSSGDDSSAGNSAIYNTSDGELVVRVRFKVGSGTYIRSLAEELGRRLAPTPKVTLFFMTIFSYLAKITRVFGFAGFEKYCHQRSLRHYWCRGLGYPATLKNLRRTKVGEFAIQDAQSLENFSL